jgi:hypothetical protein
VADPLTELRVLMVDQMRGDAALAAVARVYDEAPQENSTAYLPYITLGPSNYDIELVDCIDGGEIMLQVDVWSNEPGQAEVVRVAGLVRKSLKDFYPELSENALVEFSHWRTDYLIDGAIKHAAMRFTAIVEESAS